jgi:hypothetical protein
MARAEKHMPLVATDRKKVDLSFARTTRFLGENTKYYAETDPYQDRVTFDAPSDGSITIVGFGDAHLGAVSSKLELIKRDTQLIKDTPNVYMVSLSNLIDAFIPAHHLGGKLDSPLPLLKEALAMNDLLKGMGDKKVLGMVQSPCHEGWAQTFAGIDPQQLMAMGTDIPLLENGAVLDINFPNGERLSAGLWHQPGGGGDRTNPAWKHQKDSRLNTTDVIMIGHSHIADAEHSFFGDHPNRKEVVMMRTGSYKGNVLNEEGGVTDRFQRGFAGRDGEPGGQAVTFNPRTGQIKVHMNILRAIKYQEELNRVEAFAAMGKLHEVWSAATLIDSRIAKNNPPKQ